MKVVRLNVIVLEPVLQGRLVITIYAMDIVKMGVYVIREVIIVIVNVSMALQATNVR
jgi:hypothetical protein